MAVMSAAANLVSNTQLLKSIRFKIIIPLLVYIELIARLSYIYFKHLLSICVTPVFFICSSKLLETKSTPKQEKQNITILIEIG